MTTEAVGTQSENLTIEALFEAAEAEVEGLALKTDVEPNSPVGDTEVDDAVEQSAEDVEVSEDEQADADVDLFEFEALEEDEELEPAEAPSYPETVEIDGVEVPFEELRNGYLRQSDYTKKTQAVAEERKVWEQEQAQAVKILESLRDDPVGVAAYLAIETGLLTEDQVNKLEIANLRDAVKVPKAEEAQAEIDRRVEEAVAQHPKVREAQKRMVLDAIDSEFREIETTVGKPLSESAKKQIINYATQHDLMDLRVAFDALSAAMARKQASRDQVKRASTERPKTRGALATATTEVASLEEAFALAQAEHGEIV